MVKIRSIIAWVVLLGFALNTKAGNDNPPIGARSWGMGGITSVFSDVWSAGNNQAGLGFLEKPAFGFYGENRYRLSNLTFGNLSFALPVDIGTFGLTVNYFGYSAYNEQKLGLGYGRAFSDKFSIGFQIDYLRVNIAEFGHTDQITFEGGVQIKPVKSLTIGAHIFNPSQAEWSANIGESLPTVAHIGLGYQPSKKIMIAVETEQTFSYSTVFKTGLEYKLTQTFSLRAGIATNPTLNTFGFSFQHKGWQIDAASSIHPILGTTPHLSISHRFQ